ncbi:MAG: hypothetical protein ACD_19C00061G0001 [uncultured bacterium]|nr:MAG: hypothetical protein ACD_19C00061G0001 [uncultured bacterium]
MDNQTILLKTIEYVKETLAKDYSGHDWWHIYRVWVMAKRIQQNENGNIFVIELGALLHDIADWKFHDGDLSIGPKVAESWLTSLGVDNTIIDQVCTIINSTSFKGAKVNNKLATIEEMIVQDADRLDSMGAIGIGRTFAFGGSKGRLIFDPNKAPQLHESFDEYRNSESSSINHFYEKLLLLKDMINTETAKTIAKERHEFMCLFLDQFFAEWKGGK